MALAARTLFLAGVPDEMPEQDPYGALEGRMGARLWAVSADDGAKLAERDLGAPPVSDGMAAAGGRLIISLTDGNVVCFGGRNATRGDAQ